MLVVDRDALLPVDLLHLVGEVLLGLADALDLEDLLGVERSLDVADHNEEHIVQSVARLVVGHHVVAAERIEDLEVADDRVPVRMLAKGRGEERLSAHAIGIVVAPISFERRVEHVAEPMQDDRLAHLRPAHRANAAFLLVKAQAICVRQ